jgi:hypothetical protein
MFVCFFSFVFICFHFFSFNLSDFICVNILIIECFFVSGDESGCYEKATTCDSEGFTNEGACESASNGVSSPGNF